jgi:hypothetical protein
MRIGGGLNWLRIMSSERTVLTLAVLNLRAFLLDRW